MNEELVSLLNLLESQDIKSTSVIGWASPVISFGDLDSAIVATVGLNPSNKEFVDSAGDELDGLKRRFHTLKSLGLSKWSDADETHFEQIHQLCREYFLRNPYDNWFKKLDYIISGAQVSYYFPHCNACHLDLIPYATYLKWIDLKHSEKSLLLELTRDSLGLILKNSGIKLLVLNGRTVVKTLESMANIQLKEISMPEWILPRKAHKGISGFGYSGTITEMGHIILGKEIRVLGFNHNIQSSYGVTSKVTTEIRNWISKNANLIL